MVSFAGAGTELSKLVRGEGWSYLGIGVGFLIIAAFVHLVAGDGGGTRSLELLVRSIVIVIALVGLGMMSYSIAHFWIPAAGEARLQVSPAADTQRTGQSAWGARAWAAATITVFSLAAVILQIVNATLDLLSPG